MIDIKSKELRLEDISIVREYPDIFWGDVLGIPLGREVEFYIDLVLGVGPSSKAFY